ncbi:PTS sugar transporter subunit IIA [Enterococcus rivorum]|uniref:PTS EIIA type-2 domain-containing protein n=1 Tax=Enterococcus rivorum TaxID=762845 RepID=A0A1E5KUT3_9ENTE|nr:PTS sugar transporter subunit IIA [Enterococcus rivorum]MBP2100509.1 PTS system galactitol-specific IIA component [Enterococcus rivorum]OEH81633.1 hypothetical protein BCR26_16060 [Enterococcus rivorum]
MKKILCDTKQNYLYFTFDCQDKQELLTKMSSVLISEGFVKESYQEAVIAREEEFPTGLPTKGISVAIPHTDSIHVKREGVLVGVLERPITFEVMASRQEYVEVEIVFMLAIKEPNNQVLMLQKLISLCQNETDLMMIKAGEELEKIDQLLRGIS